MAANLYPNPTLATTTLSIDGEYDNGKIIIHNSMGQTQEFILTQNSQNTIEIDTKGWAEGIYFITLELDGEIETTRLVKNR